MPNLLRRRSVSSVCQKSTLQLCMIWSMLFQVNHTNTGLEFSLPLSAAMRIVGAVQLAIDSCERVHCPNAPEAA